MATTRKTDTAENAFPAFFKAPNFDFNAVLEAQRKNLEAVMEANRVAFEGFKTATEKQVASVRKTFDEAQGSAAELLNGKTPEVNAAKQIELAQGFVKAQIETMREVAELTAAASRDAFAVIQKRFAEGMDELKAVQAR
ncbi:MAG: hypothetical protein Kow00104_04740 [Rhodothalassiaceae bacterium]